MALIIDNSYLVVLLYIRVEQTINSEIRAVYYVSLLAAILNNIFTDHVGTKFSQYLAQQTKIRYSLNRDLIFR